MSLFPINVLEIGSSLLIKRLRYGRPIGVRYFFIKIRIIGSLFWWRIFVGNLLESTYSLLNKKLYVLSSRYLHYFSSFFI